MIMPNNWFIPAKNVDEKIDTEECNALGIILGELIMEGSDAVGYFREFVDPKTCGSHEEQDKLLRISLKVANRSMGEKAINFFERLRSFYLRLYSQGLFGTWLKVLADICEAVFESIVERKYQSSMNYYHEHLVRIENDGNIIGLGEKPVDVIGFCETNLSGEFLEIKKNLASQSGGSYDSKIKSLYDFLIDLRKIAAVTPIVGVATLTKSDGAALMIRSIIGAHLNKKIEDIDLETEGFFVINAVSVKKWSEINILLSA